MDAHAHHADLGHEHVTPLGVYFGIFGGLMALTAITVAVASVNLGSLNILVALGLAVFKASLVVLYFMHLKYSSKSPGLWSAQGSSGWRSCSAS